MSPEGKNDVWDDRIAVEELLQELLKPDLAKERALARAERLETTRAKLRGALIKVHATAKLKANQTRAQRARDVEEAQRKEAAQAAQRSAEKAREALAADQERQHREVQAQKRLRKNMALVRAVAKLKVNLDSARGRSRDASIAWTSDIKVAYDPKGTLRLWDPASDPHGLQAKLPRALKHRLRNRDLALKQRWLDNVNKT
ncbi:Hypothetical Protein FCC1311_098532 [Hondaea fermentalgiana]|uniref:Uncharacterized protein n=1 Tax=Hondaea fermentalgiana TaxID=2315210 RepID=A0A2R5GS06_9STRA|nr:Hypothetical Protein FCC1311_098532 [Hondaea fermentalgiana]|eukprot:GBG33630.1 Hypothetical Protein FCC1311_098532 [Hondaea fermentalgiana]